VLFYWLLTEHVAEMLPIVYTLTVGTAIERYSLEYGRPRGVYRSADHPGQLETAFRNYGLGPDDVDLIVATDSEGILGIGDRGVRRHRDRRRQVGRVRRCGPAASAPGHRGRAGRRARNQALLDDPMYRGSRHPRVGGERYEQLIDAYVTTATRLFPHAMLHWEDFGVANAHRIPGTPRPAARSTTTSRAPPRWYWPPR
jgi:malate dehydrogenase (oxaloacetate-decarboxylating)